MKTLVSINEALTSEFGSFHDFATLPQNWGLTGVPAMALGMGAV